MYLTRALLLLPTAACLAEKQHIPISYSIEPTILYVSHSSRDPNHYITDVGDHTAEKNNLCSNFNLDTQNRKNHTYQ